MRIEDQIARISEIVENAAVDAAKFDSGNDAAGKRLRKACIEVGRTGKSIRAGVQEVRNNRK